MENKATGVLIICNPAEAYSGLSEKEVADKYHELAFTDYDALVKFAPGYNPEKADVRRVAMWKKGKALQQTVFAEQPIVRIGDSAIACISSSYLFNPGRLVDGEVEEPLLPDLDVILLRGNGSVREGAEKIKHLYENARWKVGIYEDRIKEVRVSSGILNEARFPNGITVIDDFFLFGLAKKLTGYKIKELCFTPSNNPQDNYWNLP
jgi:hypothetical protein